MHTSEISATKTINLSTGSSEDKRAEILQYFHDTYSVYEKLFEPLTSDEAYYQRADPLRHPLIFYYGHTAVFFINKLVVGNFLPKRINPRFESMFAIGVDEMSWDDLNEQHYDWPTVQEVKEYRDTVRETVAELIRTAPLNMPIDWKSLFWVVMMGIEHERIHLETSSVLIRQLPRAMVRSMDLWPVCQESSDIAPANELLTVPGKTVELGKSQDDPYYGWDNEYGSHSLEVESFQASKYLVSNKEFLDFIKAGGYNNASYWTEEGWSWVTYQQAEHPRFWRKRENGYSLRLMLEEIDMPWNWPVEVNYLEAKAFCNWKAALTGKPIRLPMEEEWYALLHHVQVPDEPAWEKAPGNINLEYFASSVPVDHFKQGEFFDVVGNVWQWTETPIAGFTGFKIHPLYDDFSTPTFDTKHNLIKGGSWISTGNEALHASRYAFRRHFYQHAGFRYVESEMEIVVRNDSYEMDLDVVPYCEAHYGDEHFGIENYAEKIAQFALAEMLDRPRNRALHFGCKVGRTAFELAVEFDYVLGLDSSARLIRQGVAMQDKGYIHYAQPSEGEVLSFHECHLQDLGLFDVRKKVEFLQSDASNMKALYTGFDLVIADQMIDRIYDPTAFLKDISSRINPHGKLIISSPNDWKEEYTKPENWLGGYKKDGESITTLAGLKAILGEHFVLQKTSSLPSVIKKNDGTYHISRNEITVWQKK